VSASKFRGGDALRAALLALVLLALPVFAAPVASRGQPLVEVIAALEAGGLTIIYSNDLLDPSMVVRDEPHASDPVEMLREVLRPYGLGITAGPNSAWLIVREASPAAESTTLVLNGTVVDADTGAPIRRAIVRVEETGQSTLTSVRGEFRIELAGAGRYRVTAEAPDHDGATVPEVDVARGAPTPPLTIVLRARTAPIETIVVSASYYALGSDPAAPAAFLNRTQIENLPTLGEDAIRATHGLPGVASNGVSARMSVRGGESDETLLRLDGMRIYDPFHFRDFESLFSSIDPAIIEGMEVYTGGYPVAYGDRMSGVIDMRSRVPSEDLENELRVSTLNSAFSSTGRFKDGRGDWVASLRRSNLDLLVKALSPDLGEPEYLDFFSKVDYALDDHWKMAGNVLLLDDEITLQDGDVASANSNYHDAYYWARFDHAPNDAFEGHYLVSETSLEESHGGFLADEHRAFGTLSESRDVAITAIAADWLYRLSERHLLKWGAELRDGTADYVHDAEATFPDPITFQGTTRTGVNADFDTRVSGQQRALYASYVGRWAAPLTVEIGVRRDEQTYTKESEVSPRANLLFDLGPRTQLRAAAGRFFQAQGIEELQINDGVSHFFPAQEAEHIVLSLEHRFDNALRVQVEAYKKQFDRLRPRFENLYSRLDLLPELQPDRVRIDPSRGESEGIEFGLQQELQHWQWWTSLSWSSVEDQLDGAEVPRSWDQPWALAAGLIRTGERWTMSLAASYHEGWPTTSLSLVNDNLVAGPYNAQRLADFQSIDVRVSRRIALARSELTVFGELINALNHSNPCCLAYDLETDEADRLTLETGFDEWLPLVPSVGVTWRF
jgi:outer membrane receptor protein involved in Fe transport